MKKLLLLSVLLSCSGLYAMDRKEDFEPSGVELQKFSDEPGQTLAENSKKDTKFLYHISIEEHQRLQEFKQKKKKLSPCVKGLGHTIVYGLLLANLINSAVIGGQSMHEHTTFKALPYNKTLPENDAYCHYEYKDWCAEITNEKECEKYIKKDGIIIREQCEYPTTYDPQFVPGAISVGINVALFLAKVNYDVNCNN